MVVDRLLPVCLVLTLAACGAEAGEGLQQTATTQIDCSLNGAVGFGRDCTMERVTKEGQSQLVVRHPDGAFRRFDLGVPGRGIVTADGAEQAEVIERGGHVEVRVGSDRYRLPLVQ